MQCQNAGGLEMAAKRGKRGQLIFRREQQLERATWGDDQSKTGWREIEGAHIGADEPEPLTMDGRGSLIARDREHRRRSVEAGHADSGFDQLQRDATRSDPCFQDAARGAVGKAEVEFNITLSCAHADD